MTEVIGDALPHDQAFHSGNDEAIQRATASRRARSCAGTGYATLGQPGWAFVTYFSTLSVFPGFIWFAIDPGARTFWSVVALILLSTLTWVVELIAIKRIKFPFPNPLISARGHAGLAGLNCLLLIFTIGFMLVSFGQVAMTGSGMSPTLAAGERAYYHKRVIWSRVSPGVLIVYKNPDDSAWGRPGMIMVSRILAGPGDQISIEGRSYVVNGKRRSRVGDTGEFGAVIDVPAAPKTVAVPADCYFVIQDGNGFDSRVLSWVRRGDIVGSPLWHRTIDRIFRRIE